MSVWRYGDGWWMEMLMMLHTGEWESSCNELQRMLLVRSLRQDRVAFCVSSFIVNNLGSKFVEPPVLDLRQVVDDSTAKTPLIFVLSPGVVGVLSAVSFLRFLTPSYTFAVLRFSENRHCRKVFLWLSLSFITVLRLSIFFLLWASTSAAIQLGLSSSNVLCFIAIFAIVSFEQINQSVN